MWGIKRRLEIIGIILVAILLLGVFPYWLTHREVPTCFDGKQNQEEKGTDCGGPCTLVCRGDAQELKILWTKVFPVRSGIYDIVAYIENPNFNIAVPQFSYTAKLFDENGTLITEANGESFALPSERFAIFAGGLRTGEKKASRGSIEIISGYQWQKTEQTKDLFSVSDRILSGADRKPKLAAVLHNDTPDLYRDINATAIIYDSKGLPIGVSATKVAKLLPGGSENLFFTWPLPFDYVAETEQCETPVDVVLALDRSGSMRSDRRDPPEPLTAAKNAALQFVTRLSAKDQGAYVSFATDASNPIDQPLTNEIDRLKRAIDKTVIGSNGLQYTNIGDALRRSIDEFASFRRNDEAEAVIVLLTDGIPTRPEDPKNKDYPSQYALQVAAEAKKENISIYTIGLGADVEEKFLESLATSPDYYYQAASGAELAGIYQQIATAMCKKGPSVIEIIPRVNWLTLPAQN